MFTMIIMLSRSFVAIIKKPNDLIKDMRQQPSDTHTDNFNKINQDIHDNF